MLGSGVAGRRAGYHQQPAFGHVCFGTELVCDGKYQRPSMRSVPAQEERRDRCRKEKA
jgi:hypothetical protein